MSDQEESPKRETTKESISEVDAQLKRKKECCSAGCGTHGSCGCRQSKKTGRMVVSAGFTFKEWNLEVVLSVGLSVCVTTSLLTSPAVCLWARRLT